MNSKDQFAAFEFMCLERAAFAKKEMEYWLAETEEWKQLRESPDPFVEGRVIPAWALGPPLGHSPTVPMSQCPKPTSSRRKPLATTVGHLGHRRLGHPVGTHPFHHRRLVSGRVEPAPHV